MSANPSPAENDTPYPSLAAVKIANNELLNKRSANGEQPEFLCSVTVFLNKAQATGAILNIENERWTCQSILDYWCNFLDRHENVDLVEETILAPVNDKLIPDIPESKRPYVGLDAFRESKHEWFFGREKVVGELLEKIEHQRCLFIVGPSGSGKSSLVLAGLLPRLKAAAIKRSAEWQYFPPVVPGFDPMASLISLVEPPGTRAENWMKHEAAKFRQDPNHLLQLINAKKFEPALIVVDQFEEIFTLTSDENVRRAFVNNLLALIEFPDLSHRVIFTMRSDFESYVATIPELHDHFQFNSFRLTPLSAVEVQEAIQKPADLVGLRFEDGIVEELVKETVAESNGLPLLQFTLLKLWKNRKNNLVTWQAFQQVGSCREALTRSADEFYARQSPADQSRIKWILLRLVRPGTVLEVYSNRIARSDLYGSPDEREHIDRVLDGLIEAGLVRETEGNTPGELKVEVAHEALVRHWRRLVGWLDEERASLRKRLSLTEAAMRWDASGRDSSALLRGALLTEALRFEKLNPVEDAFVKASLSRQKRGSRLFIVVAIIAVTIAVIVAYYAVKGKEAATEQATQALSRELAAKALTNKNKLDLALLLAVQAYKTYDTSEARASLASLLSQPSTAHLVNYLRRPKEPVLALSLVDNSTLAGVAADGTIYIWNTKSPHEAPKLIATGVSRPVAVALTRQVCVLSKSDGEIVVVDLTNGARHQPFKIEGPADLVSVSSDGRIAAAAAELSDEIYLWETQTGKQVSQIAPTSSQDSSEQDVSALTLSNNGRLLVYAVGDYGEQIRVYDVEKQRVVHKFDGDEVDGIQETFFSLAFNSNDKILAASSDEGLTVWDLTSGVKLAKFPEEKNDTPAPLFFASDSTLVRANDEGEISIRQVREWSKAALDDRFFRDITNSTINAPPGELLATVLGGENGHLLAASTRRGDVVVWNLNEDYKLQNKLFAPQVRASWVTISRDGKTMAYAGGRSSELPAVGVVRWNDMAEQGLFTMPPAPEKTPGEQLRERFLIGDFVFTQDDSLLAAVFTELRGSDASRMLIWNVKTNVLYKPPIGPDESVSQFALSSDGKTAGLIFRKRPEGPETSTDAAKTPSRLAIWRFGGDESLQILTDIERPAAISFSYDGKTLAAVDAKGLVTFWDSQSGARSSEVALGQREDLFARSMPPSLEFSPDGKLLVVMSEGSRLAFYDLVTKQWSDQIIEESLRRPSIIFSRDSKKMALSSDRGISLWDLETRREVGTPTTDVWSGATVFSPDGMSLVYADPFGIHSVDISINSWIKRGCAIANRDLDERTEWERYVGKDVKYVKTCGLY